MFGDPHATPLDVYPLLARLLGFAPAANDGNPRTFEAALERP